jgi:2,4-dienoyl-CoA reductase-like NADH-dependent reductase (Old Yellow Enzyme family)
MDIDLFEQFSIGKMQLKNRFVRSATWDAMADNDGRVTDNSIELYRKLGQANIGLIVSGYAFVSPIGKAAIRQYGVHTDDMIPGLKRLVEAAHQGGSKIALQIAHSGTNVMLLTSDSNVELPAVSKQSDLNIQQREMTDEDIQEIVRDFSKAALRGKEAGFDAIQLHGAHGYLMSQFQSPLLNHRTDKWGGNAENRRRFHLEVIREVRKQVGEDFPLMIKYGIQDDGEEGLSLSEGLDTVRHMVREGIDGIEISANIGRAAIMAPKKGEPERAYFRDRTAAVKRTVDVPVILVGGVRSLEMAQNIVDSGDADLISMCRPFIREPDLVARWGRGDTSPAKCISCFKCSGIAARGVPLECAEERRKL